MKRFLELTTQIAVIGGGPAGLSAASYLADLGVQATIFEAHQDLGGMVASVIPAYRLTREALRSDLDRIAQKGVEVKFGQKLGDNISIEGLKKAGFDAIFLGIGAAAGKKLGIEGEVTLDDIEMTPALEQAMAEAKAEAEKAGRASAARLQPSSSSTASSSRPRRGAMRI